MSTIYVNPETFQPFVEIELVPKVNGKLQEQLSFSVFMPVETIQDARTMNENERKELMKGSVVDYADVDVSNFQKNRSIMDKNNDKS